MIVCAKSCVVDLGLLNLAISGSHSVCVSFIELSDQVSYRWYVLSRFSTRRNILRAAENLLFFIEYRQKRTLKSRIKFSGSSFPDQLFRR